MTDLSRILDERMNDRIIAAINDLDFAQFQQLIINLLSHIGVKVVEKEEEGDAVFFRGEGEDRKYIVMASRMFDHASIGSVRRLKSLAAANNSSPVLMITHDLDQDAKRLADKEEVSYADKPKLLLLLRKYELADKMMEEIDKKVLESDGSRVLPSAGKFDHHMTAAMEHMEKAQYRESLYDLDRALELKPNHDEVWQLRANALMEMGKLDEALESSQKATELRSSNHAAWYVTGLIKGQMGDYDGEVKAYEMVLRLQPNNRSALLNKGTALYRLKRPEQALKVYDQMIKAYPGDAMAYNNRGIVLKALGRLPEALESFSRSAALDRSYVNPIINSGLIHSESGQEQEAIEDWKRALQLERRRPEIWLSLGLSQRNIGELEEAVGSFEKALELDPGLEESRRQKAEIEALLVPPAQPAPVAQPEPAMVEEPAPVQEPEVEAPAEGPKELAVEAEKELVEIRPEENLPAIMVEPRVPAVISEEKAIKVPEEPALPAKLEEPGPLMESTPQVVSLKEQPPAPLQKIEVSEPEAVEAPEEALEPTRRTFLTIRMLMLVGDYDTALKEIARAMTDAPESMELISLKAKALLALGRFDEAVPLLSDLYANNRDERLLYDLESISNIFGRKSDGPAIMSKTAPSQESLARELSLLLERKQYDDAIAKSSKADKLTSEMIKQVQALSLMMKGRYRDAAKLWKQILDVHPGKAEALNNLGVCMRFMGEFGYDEPVQYMRLATMIDPEYADAWNNVGCVYFAIGVYEESLKALQKAISIDRRPDYYLNLSSVQMALSDVAGAKQSLASALKLEETPEVLFMLAVIAEKEGDMKWAASLYEDAVRLKPDFRDAIFNLQRVKLFLKYNKER